MSAEAVRQSSLVRSSKEMIHLEYSSSQRPFPPFDASVSFEANGSGDQVADHSMLQSESGAAREGSRGWSSYFSHGASRYINR
jgi:hypothetical protein